MRHSNSSSYWGTQVAWGWEDNANKLAQRNVQSGNFSGWVYYLNSGNFTNYAAPAVHSHDYATHRGEGTNYIEYARNIYDNGAYTGAAAWREPSSMHVYYANLGRYVYNNGAYSGSGWIEPSDLGVRYAGSSGSSSRASRSNGNFYIDDNYGYGIVGAYNASRYQGVFAMGDAYKLPAGGENTGGLYGMAWSHPNAGGAAGNLTDHGLLIINNGGFRCAISNSIVASANVTAYSDERLKTNWRDLPVNFISKLAAIKVGIYDRIDGDKITQVGVSAQSLQALLPDAIQTANDDMKTLSVSYGNAALASAVELAKEVVSLRQRLERLESLINKQESP